VHDGRATRGRPVHSGRATRGRGHTTGRCGYAKDGPSIMRRTANSACDEQRAGATKICDETLRPEYG